MLRDAVEALRREPPTPIEACSSGTSLTRTTPDSRTTHPNSSRETSRLLPRLRDSLDTPAHPEPILLHTTPHSALARPVDHAPRIIRERPRRATCSGVAWFHGDCLATIHLVDNALHTYRFDAEARTLTPIQSLVDLDCFAKPENLAFSRDGLLLATTNSRDGAVHVFAVDPETHLVDPQPRATLRTEGDVNAHGVSFSPCSRFLAFTTVDEPGFVRVCRIHRDASGRIDAEVIQSLPNAHAPLKPKGIDFSPDGRFVSICYSPNAARMKKRSIVRFFAGIAGTFGDRRGNGFLLVHPHAEGRIARDPIPGAKRRLRLNNPDDVKYFPNRSLLVVTDQAADTATLVQLEERSGALRERVMTLANPPAQLSFPHGIGISEDGRYLAIANYGDDKLAIYAPWGEADPDRSSAG